MRRPVLTYANVMSSIAVVLAMSGTAVAATQISGSTIKDRTVGHKKLVLNTVTGAEVNESTLGRVPSASSATNAGTLDGLDSTAFVKGAGVKVYRAKLTGMANDAATQTLLTVPSLGQLGVHCNGDTFAWIFTNTTSTKEWASTVSGDNFSQLAQFLSSPLPPTSGNIVFFHDNSTANDAAFQDDI